MTIKGTLETFNLLDLLQMLSFNQKVGTLVLETADGPRTVFVEGSSFGFVQGDTTPSKALARVLRRGGLVPAGRLERGLAITANSGRFLGDALSELGVLDPERRQATWRRAVEELFFDLLQTPITRFEFVEGQRLSPSGLAGEAIQPLCAVDSVLLEMTRKVDEWRLVEREVGGGAEVFEPTGTSPDLVEAGREAEHATERVLPLLDGRRTVTQIVESSDCDRLTVAKFVGTLVRQGALAPVPTSSLLARAEEAIAMGGARDAVPLLRRALDRGDAPATARVRLADALEACGEAASAAAELDTFATGFEEAEPVAAFDALRRAMALRGGDGATAARVCDAYLRHRSHLGDRAEHAHEALKRLVHAASAGGRPLDAAHRLAAFLDANEAPGEDRLVLADLYASAGMPSEAAQALVRRSDDLVAEGRASAARDLLRRAIGYDSTRADARRRIADIEGRDRRRRHKRRVVVLLLLLATVAGTAGTAYLMVDGRTAHGVETALARADEAAKDAERQMTIAHAAWAGALVAASASSTTSDDLAKAASELRAASERVVGALKGAVHQTSVDLAALGAAGKGGDGAVRLRGLEARHHALVARVDGALKEAGDRAERALLSGEKAFADGRFREARPLLVQAVNLSFDAPARAALATQRLGHVDSYLASYRKARQDFDEACAAGDTDCAWRAGSRLLARFLDSDVTREILLPVPVVSDPPGAEVRLGDVSPVPAPTTLSYSPFGDLDLRLRAPGRVPVLVRLPSFKDLVEAEKSGGSTPFRVSAKLAEGPRWTASPAGGVHAGPFVVGEALMVSADEGRRVVVVRTSDGAVTDARALSHRLERVRMIGRGPGGVWVLEGLRTLAWVPDAGGIGWQVQTLGRLDAPPVFSGGVAAIVDETGAYYGVDVADGRVRFRKALAFGPIQPAFATALGIVVTTLGGEGVAISVTTGDAHHLVTPDPKSRVFLAPWRDGAAVLGGGDPGVAFLTPARERTTLGSASPDFGVAPSPSAEGLAWVDRDGRVRWLSAAPDSKPVTLSGLGAPAFPVVVAGGFAYAVGRDGVLRAVRLDSPGAAAWQSRLPAPARGPLLVHGDAVLVATEQGLVAFDR